MWRVTRLPGLAGDNRIRLIPTTWLKSSGPETGIITGCSKRPLSKAAASEEARRTLRYVEPLSDARTLLTDFFSILLGFQLFQ